MVKLGDLVKICDEINSLQIVGDNCVYWEDGTIHIYEGNKYVRSKKLSMPFSDFLKKYYDCEVVAISSDVSSCGGDNVYIKLSKEKESNV